MKGYFKEQLIIEILKEAQTFPTLRLDSSKNKTKTCADEGALNYRLYS